MKRVTLWVVGAGVASVALMIALRAQEQAAKPISASNPPGPSSAPAAPVGPEVVAFTFTDDTQMNQFAQLWQQRQAALTRMAVLQSYWSQEQGILAQMNQQLLSQFNLDVNKNYTLDADRKVLVEQPLTPEQQAAAAATQSGATPGQASPAAPAPSEPATP